MLVIRLIRLVGLWCKVREGSVSGKVGGDGIVLGLLRGRVGSSLVYGWMV